MLKNKVMATMIALILMLIIAIPLSALSPVTGQATRKTYAVVGATPNPVGVGQETLLMVGITHATAWPQPGWVDLTITVTRPDGTTEKLGPFNTDTTGLTGAVYVPTLVGTYKLQTHFPEQVITTTARGTPAGTIMEASESRVLDFIVQEEPIKYYQDHPLPTEYWTRPIDAQHREWSTIAGNWMTTPLNYFAPNNQGPETAHILWTKPLSMGGLVGGDLDDHAFECGDAYEGKWGSSVILGGKLFYNRYNTQTMVSALGSVAVEQEVVAVDLHTGEELWAKILGNNERLSFGQLMYWDTMNNHGAYAYLWTTVGTTWHAYEALTGRWAYSITGVPSGTNVYGPKGEILRYSMNTAQGWMTQWNSTSVVYETYRQMYKANPNQAHLADYYAGRWRPHGITFNASVGVDWNKTIPLNLRGSAWRYYVNDRVIGTSISTGEVVAWGLSLKPGQEGTLLFNKAWKAPNEWALANITVSRGAISADDGLFTLRAMESRVRYGFSTNTGDFLWQTEPLPDLDYLMGGMAGEAGAIAYGKFFSGTMGGILHCYDAVSGKLLWTYEATDPYNEILWSGNWPLVYLVITDGKIYIAHTEHSVIDPKPRAAPFICLDVETGEEIWRVDGMFRSTVWGGRAIIGDSIIATMDTYDQRIYAIGKGPSAITVEAPMTSVTLGSRLVVRGMVTDISPGTKDPALTMRFPNGVPAIADNDMSQWMLYVYKQFPRPTDASGVEVTIDVIDANGNYRNIGITTTDASGTFSYSWKPDIPGDYTVIASFAGSKSYYPSYAQTAFVVDEAPEPAAEPTQPPASVADMYFVPAIAGLFAAILVVGALMILMLRKRP